MIADILTVAVKELRELFWLGGTVRGGRVSLFILLGMFGVFMPYQFGEDWVASPSSLAYWAWLPLMIVAGAVADSFAGERERHTLETLLASRLPDRAILLGKVVASVGYGWGLVLAMLGLGIITVNVTAGASHFIWFPWRMAVGAPLFALLGASVAAGAGILVSLRAPTVRQAAQTLNVAILLVIFVPVLGAQALPLAWKSQASAWSRTVGPDGLMALAAVVLATLAAGLLAVAMARFRRARLVLD